jgi:hypothetical protein
METLGSLIDRLTTVNLKMWNAQEILYKIRKMSFDEFLSTYKSNEGMKELYDTFQKACDLNMQRNVLIDDIDKRIVDIVKSDNPDEFWQKKWKTY